MFQVWKRNWICAPSESEAGFEITGKEGSKVSTDRWISGIQAALGVMKDGAKRLPGAWRQKKSDKRVW